MAIKNVYLIRHGQTTGNVEQRYSGGRTDDPLTDEGRQVAREAKAYYKELLSPFKDELKIFASPLSRAVETANIVFENPKMVINDNVREMYFGIFEGKSYKDLNGTPEFQAWVDSGGKAPIPEAETKEELANRIYKGIMECFENKDKDEVIAIVCHGGSIMGIMNKLTGRGFHEFLVDNLCGYCLKLETEDEGMHLISYDSLDYRSNS